MSNEKIIILVLFFLFPCFNANSSEDPNIFLKRELGTEKLAFKKVQEGDKIYLNNIIKMPAIDKCGFLSLEFAKSDLSSEAIENIFYNKAHHSHIFLLEGFEPIIEDDKFILNIYSGILLHLRNKPNKLDKYNTFNNNDTFAIVRNVSGNVMYSNDKYLIKEKLNDYYINYIGPSVKKDEGENHLSTKNNIYYRPNKCEPKIIE